MASYANNELNTVADYIAKEAGVGLYNSSTLLGVINTQYSKEYGGKSGGGRVGNTIRVKFPAQFTTTSDVVLSSSTVQAIIATHKTLVLDTRAGVHTELDTEQVTLEIDAKGTEYSETVLQPMGKALRAKIEVDGFKEIALKAQNTIVLETPYDDADVLRQSFVDMRTRLDQQLAPVGDRTAIVTSPVESKVASTFLPLFHSKEEIDDAFKEGTVKKYGGLTWMASDLCYTRVNGAGGEGGTVGSYTEGSDTMVITAAVSGDLDNLAVGDKITIGAKLVNPEMPSISYGVDIQRAILSVTGSGASVTVTIDPIFTAESGARQNTAGATSDDAIVGATVAVLGTAGETYACMPVFQKSGATLGSADLYMPKNVEMSSREVMNNVSFRFIRFYDGFGDVLPNRLEALYTWDLLRPQWCGVVEAKIS